MKIIVRAQQILRLSGYITFECRYSSTIKFIQNVLIYTLVASLMIPLLISLMNVNNFFDFLETVSIFSDTSTICCADVALKLQTAKMIQLIDNIERLATKRAEISVPIKNIYHTTDSNVEKLTKKISLLASIVIFVLITYPTFLTGLVFLDESKSIDSLRLIIPMMYVISVHFTIQFTIISVYFAYNFKAAIRLENSVRICNDQFDANTGDNFLSYVTRMCSICAYRDFSVSVRSIVGYSA